MTNILQKRRYPGTVPFDDTDLDRLVFKGRDIESQNLFNMVMAYKLVMLYAKSGMGKTSLINAGIMQNLRHQGLIPLTVRFNDQSITPIQTLYRTVNDRVKQQGIGYTDGDKTSLWHYLKTAEFWSPDDVLLTPVFIFDQFEEFFTNHSIENRISFITELANIVRGRAPKTVSEISTDTHAKSDTAPEVKIVISIREDMLGLLEELSLEIPNILQNRFRLSYLSRQNAMESIIQPALTQNEHLDTKPFSYSEDALNEILNFLNRHRKGKKQIESDEIEPFQLQLLCQEFENKIWQKQQTGDEVIEIKQNDLGGQAGMNRILENFYNNRNKEFNWWQRRKVRSLSE